MKRLLYILLVIAIGLCSWTTVSAQEQSDSVKTDSVVVSRRFVTPVEVKTNRTLLPRKGEKLRYIEHDSLALDSIRRDSIAKIYPRYPKITDITVGANVGDAVARLFGQHYSSFDFSLSVNMWNRVSPIVELGLGWAKATPEELNYTYKSKLAPYMKVGANYNLMFKSHPDYQFFVGARFGYSTFTYDLLNITFTDGYWDESKQMDIRGLKSHAFWGEVTLGLKVKLWQRISAGWTVKYHNVFSYKKNDVGDPWFVPGFGSRTSKLSVGVSVYYTLPMSKKKWPNVDENGKLVKELDQPAVKPTPEQTPAQ